jgi:hypothetical protein
MDTIEPAVEKKHAKTPRRPLQPQLQLLVTRLEAIGVHNNDGMGAALVELGVWTPDDLDLLDDWAVAELDTELKEGGASLGDRAKLRIRGVGSPSEFSVVVAQAHGGAEANTLQPRRAQVKNEVGDLKAESGSGLSADTLALVSTAVLGIATFVLQARVAKNAEETQQELQQARVEHERARELAAVQLVRVRAQMGEVYRPVAAMLNQAEKCGVYMAHELGFEWLDIMGYEFVRPFTLWPHTEVCTNDYTSTFFAALKGSPYRKYSPADIALLEDPTKRQLYIEAHTGCMAPRWREVATILSSKSALIENPVASYLNGVFPDGVTDWTKFSAASLSHPMFDMAAFAYAWAPLERRWESGGAPSLTPSRLFAAKRWNLSE